MPRSIWMKYSTLLVVSLLLLQGFNAFAEEPKATEDPKPTNSTPVDPKPVPHTILMLGVPLSGKMNGSDSITFEFHSNISAGHNPTYSIYLPGYSEAHFHYDASHADNSTAEKVVVEKTHTAKRTGDHYIHSFTGKNGTYFFHLKHLETGATHEHNYTIVMSISTPFTAGKSVVDIVGTSLIKSYDLKVENASALKLDAAQCVGDVEIVIIHDTYNYYVDSFGTGYIAPEDPIKIEKAMIVHIAVLQKTPSVNGVTEAAEYKLKVSLKDLEYVRPNDWKDTQKLVNFSNITNQIEFEQAQILDESKPKLSQFNVTYKLVAATTQKDVNRTLRCGPRKDEKNAHVQTVVLHNCTNVTCLAPVTKFILPTQMIYLGLVGNVKSNKTNDTEKVIYGEILTAYHVPTVTPDNGSFFKDKTFIIAVIAAVAVLLIIGVCCWRRSQHLSLKMEEEQSGGSYHPISA